MSVEIEIDTIEDAFNIFDLAAKDGSLFDAGDIVSYSVPEFFEEDEEEYWDQIDKLKFGGWVSQKIKILSEEHAQIGGPFLDAYGKINNDLQRLYAYAKYGNADIRSLTQEDLDYFHITVTVQDGCSEYLDNVKELVEKLGTKALERMSGREVLIMVVGLGIVVSGGYGFATYLEGRKETRLEEIRSEERREALQSMKYASEEQSKRFGEIIQIMRSNSESTNRALQTGINLQAELLKAASKTGSVDMNGIHLERSESRELSRSGRRMSQQKVIEQEFRIVGGNTSDPIHTQLIAEDLVSGKQIKVEFADRLISEAKRSIVFKALERRSNIWLRLNIKEVESEIVKAEIMDVVHQPDIPATGSLKARLMRGPHTNDRQLEK